MNTPYGKLLVVAMAALLFAAVSANAALIGLYQFEDASGTVGSSIADTSGNIRNGTVTGAAITLAPGVAGHGNAGQHKDTQQRKNGDKARVHNCFRLPHSLCSMPVAAAGHVGGIASSDTLGRFALTPRSRASS